MKKIITKWLMAGFLSFVMYGGAFAQAIDPSDALKIDDFESGVGTWGASGNSAWMSIIANPAPGGINTSSNVLATQMITDCIWDGAITVATGGVSHTPYINFPITAGLYKYMHVMEYRTVASGWTTPVNVGATTVKINDSNGGVTLTQVAGSVPQANVWVDMVYQIPTNRAVNYIYLMPDNSTTQGVNAFVCYDNIIVTNDPTPRTAGGAPQPEVTGIGSMIETGIPLYPQRNGAAPGDPVAGLTFNFKLVTVGSTTYAWTKSSQPEGLADYSSQLRYWEPGKTELNLLGRANGNTESYGTARLPIVNPVTVTFFDDCNGFNETDDFTYDYTQLNSKDPSDTEAPVLTCNYAQTDLNLDLTLSATDNSDAYFYYIVDKDNRVETVTFFDGDFNLKLSAGTAYDIKVYAIDFSGNVSEPTEIQVETDPVDYSQIPSEYCSYPIGTTDVQHALMSMITGPDGKFYMMIAPYDEGNTETSFRNDGYNDDRVQLMTVNGNANTGFKYFTRKISADKMYITFTPVEGMMKPGDQIYTNQALEYKTTADGDSGGNLYPNYAFTYTYGTTCEGVEPPTPQEPPTPVTYECNGNDILSGVDFATGTPYYAPGWNESTNYTQAWDNGALTLHLGDATYEDWEAQFLITCASQTLVPGKTYFLSFDIKTNVNLPRVYMKLQASADNDHFVDLPSLSVVAGKQTVSGITVNTAGAFDEILFDFGGNPANADITISNITVCDDYKVAGETPSGPTEPATPTLDPSNVLSVYCNAYTNIAGINYNPGWGQTTQVDPNYAVGSSKLLQYTNFNYQGTEFPDQNVTDMTYLHIEVWSPTAFTTNIYPISHDPADDTKSYPLALQANQWNVFDIPLSAFVMPQYSIWQFKFDSGTGNTFYIANWYFYNENTSPDTEAPTNFTATKGTVTKNSVELLLNADDNSGAVFYTIKYGTPVQTVTVGGKAGVQRSYTLSGLNDNTDYTFTITVKDRAGNTNADELTVDATTPIDPLAQPTVAAPTPTVPAEDVMSVFSSAYTAYNWFNYGSWGQTTTRSTVSIAGVNTMKLENFNYLGFEFVGAGGAWDVSGMKKLHIDVWTPNLTAFNLEISGGNTDCTPLAQGVWNSFDIPLTAFAGATLNDIEIMKFTGTGPVPAQNTAYLDNIYFYNDLTGMATPNANNPIVYTAKGWLYVSGSTDAVKVYNLLGKPVYQNASAKDLSVELPQGMYIVKIGTNATKVIVK